jgi:hypothetical protein
MMRKKKKIKENETFNTCINSDYNIIGIIKMIPTRQIHDIKEKLSVVIYVYYTCCSKMTRGLFAFGNKCALCIHCW